MRPIVVKVGGSTLGSNDTAMEDIAALVAAGRPTVVVHGGGSAATDWLKVHGVTSEFVDGLRVTRDDAIDVVVAVFAGLVNKELVATLRNLGTKPVGLSGVDGGLIATKQADPRLGFVGEVTNVDRTLLDHLLAGGYLPVISPIGFWDDGSGHLMNINADTVAGEVAAAVDALELVFLTDVAAVRNGKGEDLGWIVPDEVEKLIASGAATSGMIPKLKACARAASVGVTCHIVDGRESHALRDSLNGIPLGTLVTA